MGYAEGQLATNERIIRSERQHWVFPLLVAGRWVLIALVVGIVGFFLAWWVQGSGDGGFVDAFFSLIHNVVALVTAVALAFAVIGLVWSTIQWRSQEYVLTDRRVMHLHGVVNKQTSDSSLENLTDVQISVPWLGRVLGFGHLILMTPSEAGIESLRCLKDPVEFKKAMMDAKQERLIEINTPRVTPAPPLRAVTQSPENPPATASPSVPAWPSAPAAAAPATAVPPTAAPPTPVPSTSAPVAPSPTTTPTTEAGPAMAVPAVAETPAAPSEPTEEAPSVATSADAVAHALATLADLRDNGAITPEDYEAKKADLLSRI